MVNNYLDSNCKKKIKLNNYAWTKKKSLIKYVLNSTLNEIWFGENLFIKLYGRVSVVDPKSSQIKRYLPHFNAYLWRSLWCRFVVCMLSYTDFNHNSIPTLIIFVLDRYPYKLNY